MARTIFEIETGVLAFEVVDKAAVGYVDTWQAPAGKTLANVTIADYESTADDWSCQTTSGSLTASADTTTKDIPATFCEPGETIPTPGKSTFELAVTFLQDPIVSTGLNRFLFEHDTEEAYFLLGFNGADPPLAIGRVRLTAATIGGEARATLTADITLPCSRKPDIAFGDATTSVMVEGDGTVTPGTLMATTASESSSSSKSSSKQPAAANA